MVSHKSKVMVYGANGYSAKLIIEEFLSRDIKPILAGRNEKSIKSLAESFNCQFNIFDLTNPDLIDEALEGTNTLLNCAGPFIFTAKELIESCLRTKTNYLDITGEIPVLHLAFSFSQKAKEAGIVILPSVGFDIIPTDCLAKRLHEKMTDTTTLRLGLYNQGGGISRGTSLTSLEFLGGQGRIRKNGNVIDSPIGEHAIEVSLDDFSFRGISIPWGDVYSAYHSTGISNIIVYMGVSNIIFASRRILKKILKLFSIKLIKKITAFMIKNFVSGPSSSKRNSTFTCVWGRVENESGKIHEEVYQVMEGYNLTAKGSVESVLRVMNNEVAAGTFTPSLAFGSSYLDLFTVKKIK